MDLQIEFCIPELGGQMINGIDPYKLMGYKRFLISLFLPGGLWQIYYKKKQGTTKIKKNTPSKMAKKGVLDYSAVKGRIAKFQIVPISRLK